MIVPFGTYKGKGLKGASFTIGSSGKRASFHGVASVGLLCGAKTTPVAWHGHPQSLNLTLPPLAMIAFRRQP